MIPRFSANGNLPPGIHFARWDEIKKRFSWTDKRRQLLTGLRSAIDTLSEAGCQLVYINGSFVTNKDEPGDIDVAWEPSGVDVERLLELEPVFGDFSKRRAAQKAKFGCEFFPASVTADPVGNTFLEFFQADKETEEPKGIIALKL